MSLNTRFEQQMKASKQQVHKGLHNLLVTSLLSLASQSASTEQQHHEVAKLKKMALRLGYECE